MEMFSHLDRNISNEDDAQFEDIRVTVSCCYVSMEETSYHT
jgi:hypothetical protein